MANGMDLNYGEFVRLVTKAVVNAKWEVSLPCRNNHIDISSSSARPSHFVDEKEAEAEKVKMNR